MRHANNCCAAFTVSVYVLLIHNYFSIVLHSLMIPFWCEGKAASVSCCEFLYASRSLSFGRLFRCHNPLRTSFELRCNADHRVHSLITAFLLFRFFTWCRASPDPAIVVLFHSYVYLWVFLPGLPKWRGDFQRETYFHRLRKHGTKW